MRDGDTIVALSSGSVPAGVAVIRLSGPATRDLLLSFAGELPPPRRLSMRTLRDGKEVLDRGLVAWFPGPRSFTGEDSAELQLHGSPAVVRAVLRALTGRAGVRLAEAGEFTRRAFENGRLDLTAVEGLGDLIAAETENQRRQALARAAGGLADRVVHWRSALVELRAEIEARLDFSDEGDVGLDLPPRVAVSLDALRAELGEALSNFGRGRIVRDGLRVALAGPPNVGKSSLLNALARSELAIVSDEPGTTRDVREVAMDLGGQLVLLVDMAGLRQAESKAEAEGVRRAEREVAQADLVLWLTAPDVPAQEPPASPAEIWRIASKSDLGRGEEALAISSRIGAGISELLERLTAFAQTRGGGGDAPLLSRERDREAIATALEALDGAAEALGQAEVAAELLRQASHSLARLIGAVDTEAVLDRLFLSFCIGK
ncbi:MAG: tRNA uridine-5-carboxymethylaminomethyl(34) synthesis GTPase MnmE [Devosia sp.]